MKTFFFVIILVIIILNWDSFINLFNFNNTDNLYNKINTNNYKFKKNQKYFVWQIEKKQFNSIINLNNILKDYKKDLKFNKKYDINNIINNNSELFKMKHDCFEYPNKTYYLNYENNLTEDKFYTEKNIYNKNWIIKDGKLDIDYKKYNLLNNIIIQDKNKIISGILKLSGLFYYPPGSFREWHTNKNKPGYRLYYIKTLESNKSYLNFIHPISGELISVPDKKECINLFMIPQEYEYLWHNIISYTHRISIGFHIYDINIINKLKKIAKNKY